MKVKSEMFGDKIKLTNALGESAYVEKMPVSGEVVRFSGANGPVNRMVESVSGYKTPSQIWQEIKGKAHLYQTAYWGTKCVKILRVVCDGTFSVHHPIFGECHVGAYELHDFCL